MRPRLLSLLLTLILIPGASWAQFRYFTKTEGLPSNTVNNLFQDSDGFIWACTSAGLSYHNGKRFIPVETLSGKTVYCVCEPFNNGELWIGTSEGLYSVKRESRVVEPIVINLEGQDLSGLSIFRIATDSDHNVWIGGYGAGIFGYSPKSGKWKKYDSVGKTVRHILIGKDKSVWVCAADKYIYRYNVAKDDFDVIPIRDKFSSVAMTMAACACQDSNGDVWICSVDSKLFKLSLIDMQSIMIPFDFPLETITPRAIEERTVGELVIGTNSGLLSFDTRHLTFSRLDKGDSYHNGTLNDKFVHALLKDIDGGLWIGTYFGGVNYMPSGANYVDTIYPASGCGNIISVMAESGDATVLIGSDDGGLSVYNTRTGDYSRVDIDPSHLNLNIHALLLETDDIWIGTYGNGLYRLDGNLAAKRHYTLNDVDKGDMNVYSAYRDKEGTLWIGTKRGIATFNPRTDSFTRRLELEDNSDVTAMTEYNGSLWFASQGCGLIRYDSYSDSFEILQEKDENLPRSLTCLQVYDSCLFAGGNGELIMMDADGKAGKVEGILHKNDRVCGMLADNSGLWITTSQGVICHEKGQRPRYFNSEDGLMNEQFSQSSIIRLSNGSILVGTNGGINGFLPQELKSNALHRPLKVAITEFADITPDGLRNELPISENIVLKGDASSFAIEFAAINYESRSKVIYRYRLKGYDNKWNTVAQENLDNGLIYGHLKPGYYTFEVAAAPSSEDEFGEGTSIKIEVKASLWSLLSKIILGVVILAILAALVISLLANFTFKSLRSQSIGLALGNIMVQAQPETTQRESNDSMMRELILKKGGPEEDKFISGVCAFIESQIHNQNLSVDDIAQEMNVSRATVFNKVKTILDTTPNQVIKLLRLERAADELCKYNVRISDVYYSVGFMSGSYFTKLFRKEFGMTPKEFARKYKDKDAWRKDILNQTD